MTELLSCPFCGSMPAIVQKVTIFESVEPVFYSVCCNCKTSTGTYPTKKEVVAAWNRRTAINTTEIDIEKWWHSLSPEEKLATIERNKNEN